MYIFKAHYVFYIGENPEPMACHSEFTVDDAGGEMTKADVWRKALEIAIEDETVCDYGKLYGIEYIAE